MSFGLLGFAGPGAALCLSLLLPSSQVTQLQGRNYNLLCLCKESQGLAVSLEIKNKKTQVLEITLHKVREPEQEILPKIACLSPLFLFKIKTVLL